MTDQTVNSLDGPSAASPLPTIGVSFDVNLEPPRHGRVSVFFRGILVLPHLVVVAVLEIIAVALLLGTWPYALICGRIPKAVHQFEVGVVRYSSNVVAYSWLITSHWPRITLRPYAANNVEIKIPHEPLGRLSVLVRPLCVVPAYVVASILTTGLSPILFVMWFCALVSKRTPETLHQATATVIRFSRKTVAYLLLTTSVSPFRNTLSGVSWIADPRPEGVGQQVTLRRAVGFTATRSWDISRAARIWVGLVFAFGIAINVYQYERHKTLSDTSFLTTMSARSPHAPSMWRVDATIARVTHGSRLS